MAKKPTEQSAAEPIEPAAHYRVQASSRFRAAGVGFGPLSRTEVTGAILTQVLGGEHADKVTGYTKL
jgi:hypothetical protein